MRMLLCAVLGTAVSVFASFGPANAQLLTFVAATGNDANTCLVQANPCKTLQKAINVTTANGEVRVLSRIQSNGVITKSLTINGNGNTIVGTIVVNSATAVVTLRKIGLNGVNGFANGFYIINAAAVHIEECTAERFAGSGIRIDANIAAEVSVSDSVSRDNGDAGLVAFGPTTVKLTIDNSLFENNTINGVYVAEGQSSISNSVSSGNPAGFALGGAGAMNVTASTAAANTTGFRVFGGGTMTLKSATARGNTADGLRVEGGGTAIISKSTVTNNATGVFNEGSAFTLEDNTINGNATNVGGDFPLDTGSVNYQ